MDPDKLEAFAEPLPIPKVVKPVSGHAEGHGHGPLYRMTAGEFYAKVHPEVPPTRFWGFGNSVPGPTIEVRSGSPVRVAWENQLPAKHFLPIDRHIMGAEEKLPDSRMIVHVHGARVRPEHDGWPEDGYGPGKSLMSHYPNQQDAATLWYHDHAMGINRLNILAGMAGMYLVRDAYEDSLNLPKGEFEIPLMLQDRMLRKDGQIYYPVGQLAGFPWVPEYMGNTTLMNGKILPYVDVQPRKYRFRLLNGSNARFYFLSLDDGAVFQQIGSDQGLLRAPAPVSRLTLAPGERADVVVDFAPHRGKNLLLKNYPWTLLQIRVAKTAVTDLSSLPPVLRTVERMSASSAARTRRLTLEEVDNTVDEPMMHLLDGKRWHEPISEKPEFRTTEIWELLNTTDDTHPIHLHLVRFQILDRQRIDVSALVYDNQVKYVGDAVPPDPNEMGWKDTVRATPGASTRIIVKFDSYVGRYVWHCHILEHEDNEMMRPYEVVARG